jgi:translocator protein
MESASLAVAIGIAAVWMLGVSGLGAWLTRLGPWYDRLAKPSWKPADWLFAPVWTTIFLLSALTLVLAWTAPAADGAARGWILGAFVANGLLNGLWSLLFFRLRRPDWALIEVAALWTSIVVLMWAVAPHAGLAALLLLPYLLWVSFAAVLNLAIVQRNRPFPGA